MACVEVCPVYIDPLNKILELRRNEVMLQDKYPAGFTDVFKGLDGRGNPWNMPTSERLAWMKGLEVPVVATLSPNPSPSTERGAAGGERFEYLFFVGCAASFDPRTQKIARSVVKILQHAGISFAVLGEEEGCTGDPARRIGHEYIFQILAKQNIETFQNYNVKKILTICPHCFNTLKNEYPALGGHYEVVHHTQLIERAAQRGPAQARQRDLPPRSRITIRAIWGATIASSTRQEIFCKRFQESSSSRWSAIASAGCAVARAEASCGLRKSRASASTS
jgi:Fe-S oxidoreductase